MATGLLFSLLAYGLWGLFPFYFTLLDAVSPVEVVAHRVIWSLVFVAIVLTAVRGWRALRARLAWRPVLVLAVAAAILSVNWGVYVYAVSSDQIVEASLGYFINPLVSVALGVVFLGERLRRPQWAAVGIAAVGVTIIAASSGALPWIGLILAFSFGTYGLLKKKVGFGAVESLFIETAALFPIALVILLAFESSMQAAFAQDGWGISLLLVLLGPVTAIPLMAFGAAATRIPLTTLGIVQYLTPSAIFVIGVLVYGEAMSPGRWIGFAVIWVALAAFSIDAVRASRRGRRDAALARLEVTEPS